MWKHILPRFASLAALGILLANWDKADGAEYAGVEPDGAGGGAAVVECVSEERRPALRAALCALNVASRLGWTDALRHLPFRVWASGSGDLA